MATNGPTKITLYLDDLSLETLEHLRNELAKYGHLTLYRDIFKAVRIACQAKRRAD